MCACARVWGVRQAAIRQPRPTLKKTAEYGRQLSGNPLGVGFRQRGFHFAQVFEHSCVELKNPTFLLCELPKRMAIVRNMVASTGVTNVRASVRGNC